MRVFLPIIALWAIYPLVICFTWESCDDNALLKISDLSLVQNETMMVQVKGRCSLSDDILSPIKGELLVKKKMFWGWTKVPCIGGIGSCSYDDVCSLTPYTNSCPSDLEIQGLPCKCPVSKGLYGGKLAIDLKSTDLPKWLEKGNYRVTVTMKTKNKPLLCLKIEMALK